MAFAMLAAKYQAADAPPAAGELPKALQGRRRPGRGH